MRRRATSVLRSLARRLGVSRFPETALSFDPNLGPITGHDCQTIPLAKKYTIMAQIADAEHKVFEQVEAPFSPQRYISSFD
jgi:hypothetical protein